MKWIKINVNFSLWPLPLKVCICDCYRWPQMFQSLLSLCCFCIPSIADNVENSHSLRLILATLCMTHRAEEGHTVSVPTERVSSNWGNSMSCWMFPYFRLYGRLERPLGQYTSAGDKPDWWRGFSMEKRGGRATHLGITTLLYEWMKLQEWRR